MAKVTFGEKEITTEVELLDHDDHEKTINQTVAAFNLQAFGDETEIPELNATKVESYDKPYVYKGKSKHPNWVNINVIYDKRDAKKAA